MHNRNERTQQVMLEWLHDQVNKGFDPQWMISLHYSHPSELVWQKRETKNELGWRDRISFGSHHSLWKEVSAYNYWESYRNDWDQVDSDAKHIRNIILREFFGVKRLNRPDKYDPVNLLMFHEKGKVKLQFHTHILLPKIPYFNQESIEILFNTYIRPKCNCFSRWKKIDVTAIKDDKYSIMGYLNKEVNASYTALSSYSLPIIEAT